MFDRKRSYEIIYNENVPEGALAPTFKVKFDVSMCLLEDSHYAKLNEAGFKFNIKSFRQLEISITPDASI